MTELGLWVTMRCWVGLSLLFRFSKIHYKFERTLPRLTKQDINLRGDLLCNYNIE